MRSICSRLFNLVGNEVGFINLTATYVYLEDFLKSHGVEAIDTTEADFDPNIHEAAGHEFSDTLEEGKVTRELRRGFMFKDRLLRAPNILVPSSFAPSGEA